MFQAEDLTVIAELRCILHADTLVLHGFSAAGGQPVLAGATIFRRSVAGPLDSGDECGTM
jgi:hypothetical protein